ncbi:MAG TPA: diguanylate cyclase [Actinomycetota bacterium]|nr:diguanylate cyclase [Actinomycetota bacterium]
MATIPVVVLIVAVVSAGSAQRAAGRANDGVDRTNAVLRSLAEIQDDLAVAESSVRGFLLTGRAGIGSAYTDAVGELRRDLAELDARLVEPEQRTRLDRVRELIDERIRTFRDVMVVGQARTEASQERLATLLLHGQTITGTLRGLTEGMRDAADAVARHRVEARDRSAEHSFLIQVLALPAALASAMVLLLGFTASIVRRVGRMRANAERLEEGTPLEAPDLARDELGTLSRALARTADHQSELQEELRQLATVDELTGLANRRGFFALGEHELLLAARTRAAVALLFLDLDGLKVVNDEHGHACGDQLLEEAADVIRETVRSSDLAARLGGDEFCVLLMGDLELDAERVVERMRETEARHNAAPGRRFAVSFSIGLSAVPGGRTVTLEELIDAADEAMYADKRRKRAREPADTLEPTSNPSGDA